jgi:uncharacterized protein YbjT (DUF2867 family)
MSTVLVIGASRGIGLGTVKLALKAGHSVRAMARSASAIRLRAPKLEKLDGGALDQHTIERALAGVDAVIQTLGVAIRSSAARTGLQKRSPKRRPSPAREGFGPAASCGALL